jgi:hypothetical protein
MSINHIELPASVVVGLYQSSLIDSGNTMVNKTIAEKVLEPDTGLATGSVWKCLGSNLKNILIIVKSTEAVHLPDNELTFLTGILGACKLTLADVAIVNINNHLEVSYKEFTSFFKSKIVFLFDIEPASFGLPMSFPHYQVQDFAGNSFLYSPALKELENDKVEKTKLWVCLKKLFNL